MYRKYIKRIIDFTLSFIALIILSPIFLIVSILVRIKLGTPVIFKQKRPGLNEKIFTLYKFRTMNDKKDENGNLLPDSERLTKFGKMLRSTSLDELPELINILKGDMSIIGPRPLLTRYMEYYTDEERKRHSVRPGLTGLAQSSGRNLLTWEERFKLDIEYVNNITFSVDISILFKTIKKLFKTNEILTGDENIIKDLDVERSSINEVRKSKHQLI